MQPIRNIGIFAHVDAGKTTCTERMLYLSGSIRRVGRVDEGTATTDDMQVERQRGISVRATNAALLWKGVRINLIDTPGHVDFTAEAERAMWALDGAVLLLSAREGVQAHTVMLCEGLKRMGVPFIVFINKCDHPQAEPQRALESLRRRLKVDCAMLSQDFIAGSPAEEALVEAICEHDDALMEQYLENGSLEDSAVRAALKKQSRQGLIHPALCGSALKGQGIEQLLDAVLEYLPEPAQTGDELCGVVFGVSFDKAMGRGAHVRLFSGSISARELISRPGREELKVTAIRTLGAGLPVEDLPQAQGGQVVCVYGLKDCRVGDVLGNADLLPRKVSPGELNKPLMMVQVQPKEAAQLTQLREALMEMQAENPLLDVQWEPTTRQMHISVMGSVQLEILPGILKERFGLETVFSAPTVIYMETPSRAADGFYAYTMPKPCWAILRFRIEPLPLGSGIVYEDLVDGQAMAMRYHKQVRQTIPRALKQGINGWQVTDAKITLIEGQDHIWHTHPLDFALCTPIAMMDGLQRAGSTVLEPMLKCEFAVPEEFAGRVASDVSRMRGEVVSTQSGDGIAQLTARVPVPTSMDYSVQLSALTGGKGVMSARFDGYQPCPAGEEHIMPYRGVHPLDTAKYILAARSALEGEVWA